MLMSDSTLQQLLLSAEQHVASFPSFAISVLLGGIFLMYAINQKYLINQNITKYQSGVKKIYCPSLSPPGMRARPW
jgi:hypothetical protein